MSFCRRVERRRLKEGKKNKRGLLNILRFIQYLPFFMVFLKTEPFFVSRPYWDWVRGYVSNMLRIFFGARGAWESPGSDWMESGVANRSLYWQLSYQFHSPI